MSPLAWALAWGFINFLKGFDMKQIINGKIYNTETADYIGNYETNCGSRDFGYEFTELYRTKKGAFFVAGNGGPYSRWSMPIGTNGMGGGSGIQTMTTEEALAWCEQSRIDADTISIYFSVQEA